MTRGIAQEPSEAMIEAGRKEWFVRIGHYPNDESLSAIYLAMQSASPATSEGLNRWGHPLTCNCSLCGDPDGSRAEASRTASPATSEDVVERVAKALYAHEEGYQIGDPLLDDLFTEVAETYRALATAAIAALSSPTPRDCDGEQPDCVVSGSHGFCITHSLIPTPRDTLVAAATEAIERLLTTRLSHIFTHRLSREQIESLALAALKEAQP